MLFSVAKFNFSPIKNIDGNSFLDHSSVLTFYFTEGAAQNFSSFVSNFLILFAGSCNYSFYEISLPMHWGCTSHFEQDFKQ